MRRFATAFAGLVALSLASHVALAEEVQTGPIRKRNATWKDIYEGPFQSSRLFAMPIADVIGAYQISLSGDGSLLQETGLLSSAGVLAIGVGDIAQLEYRHTSVVGIEGGTAPIPTVGVQLKLPLRERPWLPAFAVAFRIGVPRTETVMDMTVDEKATDLYLVSRLRLEGALERLTLHAGLRVASAEMVLPETDVKAEKLLYLPTGGWDFRMNRRTILAGELSLVPTFELDRMGAPKIDRGVLGRFGIRWAVHPSFIVDASMGYQLEVARQVRDEDRSPSAVVQWDIRLGGEFFIPWGAITCRALGAFCQ